MCCKDDIHAMYMAYASCPCKEIILWCDSRDCEDIPKTKRHKTSDTMTKHEETEQHAVEFAET